MKDALLGINGDGDDPISELCKESAKPEKKGLSASSPLGADHQVAFLEQAFDVGGVFLSFAGEGDGLDGGDELGELADAVGDAADLAAEGDCGDDGVEDSAVVADEEDAALALLWGRRGVAFDDEFDAEDGIHVADDSLWEGDVEVYSEEGEDEAYGHPKEGEQGC